MTPALRPFFCYYGGKWRDAPKHFPPPTHGSIIEPFAGSAGYALRYPDRGVLLYEVDPIVAGVWSYLIEVKADEILSIPDVPLDGSVDDLKLCQEAAWLVGFWLNRASAPRKTPSSWMRSGVRPGSFWGERVRQTIAGQLDYIRHWRVVHATYERCPDVEATWFIDPPYQYAGQHYRHGARSIDYAALSAWCRSRRGQTIVCEQESADWLPFELAGEVKTTRKVARSREAVWLGPAPYYLA